MNAVVSIAIGNWIPRVLTAQPSSSMLIDHLPGFYICSRDSAGIPCFSICMYVYTYISIQLFQLSI